MRVAFIHDWLLGMRGGERVLEVLCEMYPDAEIFTAFYDSGKISKAIQSKRVFKSFLSSLKGVHRYALPLYPLIAKDLSRQLHERHREKPFDVVISVSHCLAKNVRAPEGITHICYCLTPARYFWDKFDNYFGQSPLRGFIRTIIGGLRKWDISGAATIRHFLCISEFVAKRIEKVYGREADVVYPPVSNDWIEPRSEGDIGEGFLCVNALVPYKNVSLIIEAFNKLQLPLTIIGSGPLEEDLKKIAKVNVRFIEHLSDNELGVYYKKAKALLFAAEEDFGLVPIEMQFAGRPVICLGRGGVLETVTPETGVFFEEESVESIVRAVECFLENETRFHAKVCQENARRFHKDIFKEKFSDTINQLRADTESYGLGYKEAANTQ